ncbi:YqaA family protein [Gracilibacillus salinarum]|uniref:VTT domain-containing protein n=1 Tax=Gracilibacillus salinarum TaxID=2932255 RepID=A0ABY4GTB4_9BACI|nr:VTT domain-containing protein [Gracilibacillus salinarum]UOQ87451.1 VTT domain-containing protein [Gracilibacillus salinarum]
MTEMLEQLGIWGLIIAAFTESAFFVIPPDVFLIPLSGTNPYSSFWLASITVFFSILGAMLGYLLGYYIGKPLLHRWINEKTITKAERLFDKYGIIALIIAGITPIPFKVFAILGGALKMSFLPFLIGSIIGRIIRFFPIPILIYFIGDEAKHYINDQSSSVWMIAMTLLPLVTILFIVKGKKKLR